MKKLFTILTFAALIIFVAGRTNAQVYNECRGQNAVYEEVKDTKTGTVKKVQVESDNFGNAAGNQYDLAVDGAFEGETIVVLHLYTQEGFDFSLPQAALKEKGFSVYRWMNAPPSPEELKEALDKACEFWLISSYTQMLTPEHVAVIKDFFDAGHGVYIWGDNDPFYADANLVADALFGGQMLGDYWGDQVVGLKEAKTNSGLVPQHLITTGLQYVYEGITIATIQNNQYLKPLIYNSEGNIVAAYYEQDGKRAILDGGFTRLYISWDAAGTGRYVKNAAAWLVNFERFGEDKSREPKKNG
ncbi:MAG: hypothetical protein JXL97_05385 [Bacteroidales bacterium]|nr:hypothetical protein [Bacteroidales bacterium]